MENTFSLKDKVIIVTGGTGILGGAFVDAIVEAGGAVGILGRNAQIANERADAINKAGGRAIALVADVMDKSQLLNCRAQILEKFGKIDGLVNAAGWQSARRCFTARRRYFPNEPGWNETGYGSELMGDNHSYAGFWTIHC